MNHGRTGPISFRGAEVSCPNIFPIACPKFRQVVLPEYYMISFLPEYGCLKKNLGGCIPPPPRLVRLCCERLYTGCPPPPPKKKKQQQKQNNGTVDLFYFALINSSPFSPCWIDHIFLIIITQRSSNLVEKFLLDCYFRDLPLICHYSCFSRNS